MNRPTQHPFQFTALHSSLHVYVQFTVMCEISAPGICHTRRVKDPSIQQHPTLRVGNPISFSVVQNDVKPYSLQGGVPASHFINISILIRIINSILPVKWSRIKYVNARVKAQLVLIATAETIPSNDLPQNVIIFCLATDCRNAKDRTPDPQQLGK